jgi:hypothetical protein
MMLRTRPRSTNEHVVKPQPLQASHHYLGLIERGMIDGAILGVIAVSYPRRHPSVMSVRQSCAATKS